MIGLGNIGSHVATMLAGMGFGQKQPMFLWDDDKVEEVNVFPSAFFPGHVGMPKVHAVSEMVQQIGGKTEPSVERATEDTEIACDFLIVSPDSMEARKAIWAGLESGSIDTDHLFDARMGGFVGEVYHVNLSSEESKKEYRGSLGKSPEELPCGMKATAWLCGRLIPGAIGYMLTGILWGDRPPSRFMADAETGLFFMGDDTPQKGIDELDALSSALLTRDKSADTKEDVLKQWIHSLRTHAQMLEQKLEGGE